MPFVTRLPFTDRQVVQISGTSITLSGQTHYSNTGQSIINPTILYEEPEYPLTGATSGQTTVTLGGLTGYMYPSNFREDGAGLVIKPPILNLSGSTGTTTQNVTGFVLQSTTPHGSVEWAPLSGVSWSISACTSPLYVSTIEACPNPTDPLYITAGSVEFGLTPSIIADITNTRLGIGTSSPSESLHIVDGNTKIEYDNNGDAGLIISNLNNGSNARSLITMSSAGEGIQSNALLVHAGTGYTGSGTFTGSYLSNSFNITTAGGNTSNRAHINIGTRRVDGETRFFGGGNAFNSSTLLGIFYTSGLTITDMVNTDTLRVRDGATAGYVLTSDTDGVATWQYNSTGFSGNTEATCISELWVSTISGCSPVTIGSSIQSSTSSATGATSFAYGLNTIASGLRSHAEGDSTTASGNQSHAEGTGTLASANQAHAEGYLTIASGGGSHAEGDETIASGGTAHAEGDSTIAGGVSSHAEGKETKAYGVGSHSEGGSTTASGDYSHVRGYGSTASGNYSTASGYGSTSNGIISNSSGAWVTTIGNGAHAEGYNSIASGNYSHAEGGPTDEAVPGPATQGSLASGVGSHAQNIRTTASGYGSHSGGYVSIASGSTSFIHSSGSTVIGDRSAVLGGGNITGTTNNTVYVPNLNVREDYILHSDSVLEISNISNISSDFKGSYTEFDWTGITTNIISNNNPEGSAGILIGEFSDYPSTKNHGFLTYYGSGYTRSGSPTTGTDFYRNKFVLKGSDDVDGMVINPVNNNNLAKLWWEIDDNSVMILMGGGATPKGKLGIALKEDGTEEPTANFQIGGTGTTGDFKYIDGNQQNGYVLTSDADGLASWQPSSGTTGGDGLTIDPYNDVGSATTITWDVSGTSTNYEATLTGNTTLNMSNVRNGDYGTLIVHQDGVGSRTLTFGAGTNKVVNGSAGIPTLTATAGATDILSFTYNGTIFYWTIGPDYT